MNVEQTSMADDVVMELLDELSLRSVKNRQAKITCG